MDGTFEIAPLIMRQLFSIHGKVGTEIVPLIFCIMSSKSKDAYREFFYELCNISVNFKINLQPERIISDFEKASVLAAREFFPSANFKGCFFHFGKIIWRKIQSEGMATKYGNDEHFSKNMRMLKALAFVPESELELHFNELNSTLDDNEKKIAKWLQINYISGKKNVNHHIRQVFGQFLIRGSIHEPKIASKRTTVGYKLYPISLILEYMN